MMGNPLAVGNAYMREEIGKLQDELRLAQAVASDLRRQLDLVRVTLAAGTVGHAVDCECVACTAMAVL